MGATASIVGPDQVSTGTSDPDGIVSPLLIFTVIDFQTSGQLKKHTALMASALDTLQSSTRQEQNSPSQVQFDKVYALEQTGSLQVGTIRFMRFQFCFFLCFSFFCLALLFELPVGIGRRDR